MAQVDSSANSTASPFRVTNVEELKKELPGVYTELGATRELAAAGVQLALLGMLREGLLLREVRLAVGKLSAKKMMRFLAMRRMHHYIHYSVRESLLRACGKLAGFRPEVALHYLTQQLAEEASHDLYTTQTVENPYRVQVLVALPAELIGQFLSLFLGKSGFDREQLGAALGQHVLKICEQVCIRERVPDVQLIPHESRLEWLREVAIGVTMCWFQEGRDLLCATLRAAAASRRVELRRVPYEQQFFKLQHINFDAREAYADELQRRNELRVRALRPAFRAAASEMCRLVLSFL